jgi:hypothetical protein
MTGRYELIDDQPPEHQCHLPGWFSRRWHSAGVGSIWRCGVCGRRYMWRVPHLGVTPEWWDMNSHNFLHYGPYSQRIVP